MRKALAMCSILIAGAFPLFTYATIPSSQPDYSTSLNGQVTNNFFISPCINNDSLTSAQIKFIKYRLDGKGVAPNARLDVTAYGGPNCTGSNAITNGPTHNAVTVGEFFTDPFSINIVPNGSIKFRADRTGGGFVDPLGSYGSFAGVYYEMLAGVDWTGINATSTPLTALYNQNASTTLLHVGERCADEPNTFATAICSAFVFMFIPSPDIMNNYVQLPTLISQRFPVSWVFAVRSTVLNTSATSSIAMPVYSFNLKNLGLGSTTPIGNMLPNFVAFSSSTILFYFPLSLWNIGQVLIAAGLWLTLGWSIYLTVIRRFTDV